MADRLFGEYRHTIDAKNRLFFPAKMRETLGETFMLVKGSKRCISVYTRDAWNGIAADIENRKDAEGGDIKRKLGSSTYEVSADAQGRVIVPPQLIKYAGIEKNVIIAGAIFRAEIWDEEIYNNYVEERDANTSSSYDM